MFRGGKVDSRGTGITSGLSYAKGGRVGLQFGGSPFGAPIPPGSALNPTPVSNLSSGRPRFRSRGSVNPFKITGYTPRQFAPSSLMDELRLLRRGLPLSLGTAKGLGLMSIPFLPTAGIAAMNMPRTDAALQFMKGEPGELSPQEQFTFDETNIDVGDFYDELSRKNKEGKPITATDVLAGYDPETDTYPRIFGRIEDREKRAAIEKAKTGKQTENPLDDEGKALTADQLKILELEKLIEGMTKVEPKAKDTDMEESIEIDKEKFAKALGRDKARGQDISDMLLSFSSKALAPDATVKSAFAEFAADEVKRPSRVRKIDDSAAALAINKYIKGEISRAEADQYIKRIELTQKLRDESNVKTAAEYIQAADEAGFVKKVKVGLNSYYAQEGIVPKYEVVKSKDMDNPEKFKFSQDDVGVIFIEEDTREVYTFDSTGKKQPIINM
jgi:hypothetical protein